MNGNWPGEEPMLNLREKGVNLGIGRMTHEPCICNIYSRLICLAIILQNIPPVSPLLAFIHFLLTFQILPSDLESVFREEQALLLAASPTRTNQRHACGVIFGCHGFPLQCLPLEISTRAPRASPGILPMGAPPPHGQCSLC